MTTNEFKNILKNETFCKDFDLASTIIKMKLLKMREVFSLSFFIPKDEIYKDPQYVRFFICYIKKGIDFNIDNIKLDLLNNIPINTIALKYFEPIEVIEEIKNNIDKDILILNNKFYTYDELAIIFNINNCTVAHNAHLKKSKITCENSRSGFWSGKDVNDKIGIVLKVKNSDTTTLDGVELIKLTALSENINIPMATLIRRIKNKLKIFGVLTELIQEKDDLSAKNRNYYINKDDYKKIIKNKKYYIKIDRNTISNKTMGRATFNGFLLYFNILNNKTLDLNHSYSRKENIVKLKEIEKNYFNNYKLYIDTLYEYIKKSKINTYNYNSIIYITGYYTSKKILNKIFGIKDNSINKDTVLKILNHVKMGSNKYKNSIQQGETNG